jgi:DNA-binding transcriptional LysR family regulator
MDLDDIAVFVKVVQAGSFSKAARLLDMPNTTVSAKVARLERRLGVTLIRRTTRKLHVTSVGQAYFERCMRGLAEIEIAEAELSSNSVEPRGVLRITAPGDVAHGLLPLIAARYVKAYPHANIDIIVANRVVDLVGEGVDLAIRAGALKDSSLVARKWLSFTGGLWASREYLSRRGKPKMPPDLESHEYLIFSRVARHALQLNHGHRKIEVRLQGRMITDDLDTVLALARQGSGIAGLPDFLARPYAEDGTLVRVLTTMCIHSTLNNC